MTAQKFILTTTPVKVSDGTKSTYIQEIVGKGVRFTCMTPTPDPLTDAYCVIKTGEISLPVGFPIWAWSPDNASGELEISVLSAEF